jgi:hypothetical protein
MPTIKINIDAKEKDTLTINGAVIHIPTRHKMEAMLASGEIHLTGKHIKLKHHHGEDYVLTFE